MTSLTDRQLDDHYEALQIMNHATQSVGYTSVESIDATIADLTRVRDNDRYGAQPAEKPVETDGRPNPREIAVACIELLTELRKDHTALKSTIVAYGIGQYIEVTRF